MKKEIILEAINELHISDEPGLYKQFRRLLRKYVKRQTVEPIDIINWPKGCLAVGLMHQAICLEQGAASADKALSVYILAEIKEYLDRWIEKGAPIYKVDDCLMGQALLMMADYYRKMSAEIYEAASDTYAAEYKKYMAAAAKMMQFLYNHDCDSEGSLPYRPNQKNGRIFADGIGMVAPFAIGYGVLACDEDAVCLGMTQIRNFIKNGIDEETGLPWHAYSLENEGMERAESDNTPSDDIRHFGDLGWGRACGWIMYGIEAALDYTKDSDMFAAVTARKELAVIVEQQAQIYLRYMREDGLFGCNLRDTESSVDTSASAMIAYGLSNIKDAVVYRDNAINSLGHYISNDGQVTQAQGECVGFGLYGEFGSYPWSVGMALIIL